jgi:basic amino acid/polyamine antiporter, APA family
VAEAPPDGLRRRLGLLPATAMVVGGTIAVGIFLTPAGMAKSLGSPGLLLAVWAFQAAMALSGAFCFGDLAARFPQAGGGYVYLREAFGGRVAFLYGWKCLLVLDPGLTASLAIGAGAYAAVLAPGVPPKVVALAAVGLVVLANLAGVRLATGAAWVLAVAKAGVLLVLVGVGFFGSAGDWSRFVPFFERHPGSPALGPAIAGAIVSGFFSFGGWWQASNLAGEVEDAPRNVPRALTGGVVVVTVIYVAVSAVFFFLVPLAEVTSGQTFAAQAGKALFGSAGGAVLAAIVLLCVLGSLFAFMTTAPRVYYAMARDGAAPAWAGAVGERSGAPLGAVLVQACLAALLVAIGTFDAIVAYFVFVTVVFLGLTVIGLVRLRRRAGEPSRVSAWIFLACIGVVLATIGVGQPLESALGLAVVALGWPAYHFLVKPEGARA